MKHLLLLALLSTLACAKPGSGGSAAQAPKKPAPAPVEAPVLAKLVKIDETTQGNYIGVYGTKGAYIPNDSKIDPTYATLKVGTPALYTWATNCDVRCLVNGAKSGTIASTAYSNLAPFTMDLDIIDGAKHEVSIYYLDYDNNSRVASLRVLDAVTGNPLLEPLTIDKFKNGKHVVLSLKGHVTLEFTGISGGTPNVISAIMFN